jgi:hypothetical protein
LRKIKIPRTKPRTYGHSETVIHANGSRRISFYNKQKECIRTKQPKEIVDRAKGLLRMEINLKNKSLTTYSPSRKAHELLTKAYFNFIAQPLLNQIELPATVEGFTLHWLKTQSQEIRHIETVLGFNLLHTWLPTEELKQIYSSSTYDKRKKLSKEIQFPNSKQLPKLTIDFTNIS